MANIKNNLEKEVNRISSEWIKILYNEDKEVEMKEIKQNPIFKIKEGEDLPPLPPFFDSNIDNSLKIDIELMKKRIEQLGRELLPQDNPKESYLYLKGFYDATHQFMQTFEKLIEAGAFSGTEINTNN